MRHNASAHHYSWVLEAATFVLPSLATLIIEKHCQQRKSPHGPADLPLMVMMLLDVLVGEIQYCELAALVGKFPLLA